MVCGAIRNSGGRELSLHQNEVLAKLESLVSEGGKTAPLTVLSVSRTASLDAVRVELEVSWRLAELIALVAAQFYPLVGEIEDGEREERRRAEAKARFKDRYERMRKAGILAFHRCRKVDSEEEKEDVLCAVGSQFSLDIDSTRFACDQHRLRFKERLKKRRIKAAKRMRAKGWSYGLIAERVGMSTTWVRGQLALP